MSILAKDHSDPGTYLESVGERILWEVLNRLPKVGSRPYLDHLLRDYPERGGKRFRPALILLCCEMMGGNPEAAVVSATALELFHNFALIHDDIEDSSEMRRGSQTLHRVHGSPLAINAGDALHGIVHHVLLENHEKLGAQCGFCTPGMIMAAEGLLRKNGNPKISDIRLGMASNICRCTGYVKIIESVEAAAKEIISFENTP